MYIYLFIYIHIYNIYIIYIYKSLWDWYGTNKKGYRKKNMYINIYICIIYICIYNYITYNL